ncbi:hypothetical protein BZG36_04946 [Bifiguratus adelaidae]|uniref:Carrier domain-containing protein n=1 Tax=Bifiguratus adelaidae TaxID=1938954 RepID=A0A261XUK6_9FUNG|nr:hypothetical protein BZG36_04946 [Bifiguratus adelaidae]
MFAAKHAKSTPEELSTLFSQPDFYINLHHVDTVVEAFELRAKYTPKQVYMLCPSVNTYVPATFSEVFDTVERFAAEWSVKLSPLIEQANATGVKPCVALLAEGNLTYIVTCLALARLNVTINLISTRASTAGMVHLLQETDSKAIIVGQAYEQHAARVREEIGEEMVQVFSLCEIHEIAGKHATKTYTPFSDPEPLTSVAFVLHSSGSTGLPHPIRLSNRFMINNGIAFPKHGVDLTSPGGVLMQGVPLFHVLGFINGGMVRAILQNAPFALPLTKTLLVSDNDLLRSLELAKAQVLLTVPSTVDNLVKHLEQVPARWNVLSNMEYGIFYAGASLRRATAEALFGHGVPLRMGYGTTETGVLAFGDRTLSVDDYTSVRTVKDLHVVLEPKGDDVFEVFVPRSNPNVSEYVFAVGQDLYATKDFFRAVPDRKDYYEIVGRSDDTLVHVNGEKTSPLILEEIIERSPLIRKVALFGAGQLYTSLVVELDRSATSVPIYEIVQEVEESVANANKVAPKQSRILKPLVHILPFDGPTIPCSDKGNISRKKANQTFASVVEAMYNRFATESTSHAPVANGTHGTNGTNGANGTNGIDFSLEHVQRQIQLIVAHLLQVTPDALNDSKATFMDLGMDSIYIVQMTKAIHESMGINITQSLIYEHPSVHDLAQELVQIHQGSAVPTVPLKVDAAKVNEVIDKFTRRLQDVAVGELPIAPSSPQVVLMTGATGTVGVRLLHELLQQSDVSMVYVLSRKDEANLKREFEKRNLDPAVMKERTIFLNYDMKDEHLGLSMADYNLVCRTATSIVHCAWKLDFNQSLTSFENDCLFGLESLLKVATRQQLKAFHFVSSISACLNFSPGRVTEDELPNDPTIAATMGYGQSKYVGEKLVSMASRLWFLPVYIHRLGQITADSSSGLWNNREAVPIMVKTGIMHMGKMPSKDEAITWLPVDVCAKAMCDIVTQSNHCAGINVFNLVNPRESTWNQFLGYLRDAGLSFDIIPEQAWINELRSSLFADNNPGSVLADFWDQEASQTEIQVPAFDTDHGQMISNAMKEVKHLDVAFVQRVVDRWKADGWL